MLQKKGIPILLASSLMVMGWLSPAYANSKQETKTVPAQVQNVKGVEAAKISKEKALEIAQQAIPIPKGFVQRNIEFQSAWWGSQTPAWILFWDKPTPPYYGNIQIVVDGITGRILNIEMYHHQNQKSSYPPKVDFAKAKEIAMKYIEQHFPDQAKALVYDDRYERNTKPPLSGLIEYPIVFKQEVNGIPFEGNEIRISVNGEGDIVSLSYRWNEEIEFPEWKSVLPLEQAEKIYRDKVNLALKMLPPWGPQLERKMKYGYVPQGMNVFDPVYLRATDGKFITLWGDEIRQGEMDLVAIADKKLGELKNGEKISQEKALEIVKKHFSFAMPADEKLVRASFREQWGEIQTSVWEMNWETRKDGIVSGWSMAVVDAKTGRILNFNNEKHIYSDKESAEKAKTGLTKEQAEKKAIELMKSLHPDLAHQIYLQKMPKSPDEVMNARFYSFPFVRQVNGLSLEYGGIQVTIDAVTGEVTNYWFNVENLVIPETPPQVISKEEAMNIYMEKVQFPLMYVLPQPKPVMKAGETKAAKQAILVYQPRVKDFQEPFYLDAVTGKWTNRETGEPIPEDEAVNDIQGHWAEKELQLLVKYNVFDVKDHQIKPDEEITRGEMIKMLMLIENSGNKVWYDMTRPATFKDVEKSSPYFVYVENAVERNLIDRNQENFHPNEKIDREELAALIVKALGYENLAQVKDLFKNDLQDSSEVKELGSAILVTKLGILNTQDGKFLPKRKVTRADAAVAFYRYLSKRNERRF